MKKWIKIGIAAAVCLSIAAVWAVENALPYYGIKPWRMKPAENTWRFPNGAAPEIFGIRGEHMSFRTPDSLNISAFFSEATASPCKGTVLLLHGISSCKETQFQKAALLAARGWNSLSVDLRAHGESGGDYCTFGDCEKKDLKAVLDTLLARKPLLQAQPVGIWGASLGGAIALQTLAWAPRLDFGIIESTFDEYPKVAEEYGADLMLGLRFPWLTRHVLAKSGVIARFDPFSVKPVEAAAQIRRPMLFAHGSADDKIPLDFNRRNFEAVPDARKIWIEVPGAGHNNLWAYGGEGLRARVYAFLDGVIKK